MEGCIERISTPKLELPSGLHWDSHNNVLYFADILEKSINRYDPITQDLKKAVFDKAVSFIIPIKDKPNEFLTSHGDTLIKIEWDGVSTEVHNVVKIAEATGVKGVPISRFQYGKADPMGRLWTGTMCYDTMPGSVPKNEAILYYLCEGHLYPKVSPVTMPNGITFNHFDEKMYFADSANKTIYKYNCNIETGDISGLEELFKLEATDISGYPYGTTLDSDGNLLVAIFNNSKVLHLDANNKQTLISSIKLPAKQITDVTFGGENLDELYISVSNLDLNDDSFNHPNSGAIYKVIGFQCTGYPPFEVVL